MGDRLGALVNAATLAAEGMGKIAEGKADEAPLHSDVRTFRGLVTMLNGLASSARECEAEVATLRRLLQRVAMLEVRGAHELIERGDWKGLVEELQAMAHDVLAGASGGGRR